MKITLILAVFSFGFSFLPVEVPQEDLSSYRARIYQSYIQNDIASWEKALTGLEDFVNGNPNKAGLYELGLAQYGLIGFYRELGKRETAISLMNQAENTVDKMLELNENWAIANCLKGGLLGLETEFYPAKIVYLGPRALSYYDDGKELGPSSPEVCVELGNLAYHAPEMFGGDKMEAVQYFQKAIRLFDANPSLKKNNWLYLHAYAWLGRSYVALGKKEDAKTTYNRLRAYEPGFTYLDRVLLPELRNS
ncbi:MAG: tetratricopeptide repeat protein [Bacteroidota bacterium]